ncbi:MAG: transposase [Desulfobacterales bacterium]
MTVSRTPKRRGSSQNIDSSAAWAEHEFGQTELVDERLGKRLVTIATDFSEQPMASIPQACGTKAKTKAAYGFFDNDDIEVEQILAPHYQRTHDPEGSGYRQIAG